MAIPKASKSPWGGDSDVLRDHIKRMNELLVAGPPKVSKASGTKDPLSAGPISRSMYQYYYGAPLSGSVFTPGSVMTVGNGLQVTNNQPKTTTPMWAMSEHHKHHLTDQTTSPGMRVVLWIHTEGAKMHYGPPSDSNPYFYEDGPITDSTGGPIVGTITSIEGYSRIIKWDNGELQSYTLPGDDGSYSYEQCLFTEEYFLSQNKPKVETPLNVDMVHINKLVLTEDKKKNILSVLKQHQFRDKIFKDWGLEDTIEYGRGMTMLFWGPPGTGKTYGAKKIAESLGKELMVFDTASLQSSTPGQMERNLKKAFQDAHKKKAVVLLDECDSMVMSRDNMGQIMSAETNCLLTEIEKFEGVCILTTNRIGELDKALERRISLTVNFPKPEKEQRIAIWKGLIPPRFPLHEDVDLDALATEFELTGGFIKNVILNAARLAASNDKEQVCLDDFLEAIRSIENGKKGFQQTSKSPRTHGIVRTGGGKQRVKQDIEVEEEMSINQSSP